MSEFQYHDEKEMEDLAHLDELKSKLPMFVSSYFDGVDKSMTSRTKVAYARDFIQFFEYLLHSNPSLIGIEMRKIKPDVLDQITLLDLDEYMKYLSYDKSEDGKYRKRNQEQSLNRRISSLKSLYKVLYKRGILTTNPAAMLENVKPRQREIKRLEPNEVAEMLDYVEGGGGATKRQQVYRQKTKTRDLAILTLLLGTGLRVSECVGLNISNVDFKNNALSVMRKGEKGMLLYFGDEVEAALKAYMEERKKIQAAEGSEDALFLSTRRTRLSVRMIETLVKNYGREVTPLKSITPHTFRRTFGTTLYNATGDIRLTADALGHSDINTTKKFYAAQSDESRRKAARVIKLREE